MGFREYITTEELGEMISATICSSVHTELTAIGGNVEVTVDEDYTPHVIITLPKDLQCDLIIQPVKIKSNNGQLIGYTFSCYIEITCKDRMRAVEETQRLFNIWEKVAHIGTEIYHITFYPEEYER